MAHAINFAKPLDAFNSSEFEAIKGFDRGKLFMDHLEFMRYRNFFPRSKEQGEKSHSVDQKILVHVG